MGNNSRHSTSKTTREQQKIQRIGEERINNQGCSMKIVEYNKAEDIVVEFQDKHKGRVNSRYKDFIKGSVKNPYYPNVYGGMIGSKYPAKVDGKISKEYFTWHNMLVECSDSQEISCCKEWLLFETFYEWLHKQKNIEKFLKGKRWILCKDIVEENNIYSSDACYLVPPNVSRLFEEQELNTDVPEKVLQEYIKHKKGIIERIAQEEFLNGNITEECYEAMMVYKVKIRSDNND